MAGDSDKLAQDYQQLNKTAFVLGYTGVIGQELVKVLLGSRIFTKVVLIGRRTVTYEDELYKDVASVLVCSIHVECLKSTDARMRNASVASVELMQLSYS